MSDAQKVADRPAAEPPGANSVDRFFKISDRGSTFAREIRGGFATFFTMAYILVLNPDHPRQRQGQVRHTSSTAPNSSPPPPWWPR